MQIIKEQNGWKLGKKDGIHYLICPSGEEVRYGTSPDNANMWFNRTVEKGWTHLERNYYTASVVKGKIAVNKHEYKFVRSDKVDEWGKGKHLTKESARAEIEKVLPKAREKFEACRAAHQKLQSEMGFNWGYNYDGDTHGIYDEYEYISFKMDGFDFQFPIEDWIIDAD